MDRKLSAQDYAEILKAKREAGTYDYADRVFYNGKVMMKCPGGTTKSGKTCTPKGPQKLEQKGGKRWKKDLGGVNPEQAKKLSKAKNSQDLQRARGK